MAIQEYVKGHGLSTRQAKFRDAAVKAADEYLAKHNNDLKAQCHVLKWLLKAAVANSGWDALEYRDRSVVGDLLVECEQRTRRYSDKAYPLTDKQMAYAFDGVAALTRAAEDMP